MSIIYMDGFDLYSSFADLALRYPQDVISNYSVNQTGRFTGSKAVRSSSQPTEDLTIPVTIGDSFSLGVALNLQSLVSSTTGAAFIGFFNGTTLIASLGVLNTGALVVGRGDFTTNKIGAASAANLFVANIWNYIEVELTRSATAGTFNVYLNGALLLSNTSVNTGASSIDHIKLQPPGTAMLIDDLYVTNVATRLGESRIDTLRPSADTATKGFTPNSGTTNFTQVDDPVLDGDTTFNSAATVGTKDLFAIADLSVSPTVISAVQVVLVARKDNTALSQVCADITSGSTTVQGVTATLTTTYGYFPSIFAADPATSAAWTAAAINALQLGYEILT